MEAWLVLFEKYRTLPRRMAVAYKQKLPACVDVDDLEQCGLIGLMEAAKRFDPTRNVRFSTFAGSRIFGAMVDGIRDMDWGPRLLRKRGELPAMVSMEKVTCEGSRRDATLEDVIDSHAEQPGDEMEQADTVNDVLKSLPARSRYTCRSCWIEGRTWPEMARELGLSQSSVAMILRQAKRLLRHRLRELETARV